MMVIIAKTAIALRAVIMATFLSRSIHEYDEHPITGDRAGSYSSGWRRLRQRRSSFRHERKQQQARRFISFVPKLD
jgi:hypothetical protein